MTTPVDDRSMEKKGQEQQQHKSEHKRNIKFMYSVPSWLSQLRHKLTVGETSAASTIPRLRFVFGSQTKMSMQEVGAEDRVGLELAVDGRNKEELTLTYRVTRTSTIWMK